MDNKRLEILEFPEVKKILAGYTSFSVSNEMVLNLKPLSDYQELAGQFGSILTVPMLEVTPAAIDSALEQAIQTANARLDKIGALDPAEITFTNTVLALDGLYYDAELVGNRLALIKETSTNAALREAATEGIKRFEEWAVSLDYPPT